jgi:hypothetical protein
MMLVSMQLKFLQTYLNSSNDMVTKLKYCGISNNAPLWGGIKVVTHKNLESLRSIDIK